MKNYRVIKKIQINNNGDYNTQYQNYLFQEKYIKLRSHTYTNIYTFTYERETYIQK